MDIKVGDRVVVYGWAFPVRVERIYAEDSEGNETEDVRKVSAWWLYLDWGPEHGHSQVKVHDEGKIWYRYAETN